MKRVELLRRILTGDAVDEGAPTGVEARKLRDVVSSMMIQLSSADACFATSARVYVVVIGALVSGADNTWHSLLI